MPRGRGRRNREEDELDDVDEEENDVEEHDEEENDGEENDDDDDADTSPPADASPQGCTIPFKASIAADERIARLTKKLTFSIVRCTFCGSPLLDQVERYSGHTACCANGRLIVGDDVDASESRRMFWPRFDRDYVKLIEEVKLLRVQSTHEINNQLAFGKLNVECAEWNRSQVQRQGSSMPAGWTSGFGSHGGKGMTLGGRTYANFDLARASPLYAVLQPTATTEIAAAGDFYPFLRHIDDTRGGQYGGTNEIDKVSFCTSLFRDYFALHHPLARSLLRGSNEDHANADVSENSRLHFVVHPDDAVNRNDNTLGSISRPGGSTFWTVMPGLSFSILQQPSASTQRLADSQPFEVVMYPLLLPRGQGGFNAFRADNFRRPNAARGRGVQITVHEYYKRVLYQRYFNNGLGLLPRLCEQFLLDCHSRIEAIRHEQLTRLPQVRQAFSARVIRRDRARALQGGGSSLFAETINESTIRGNSKLWNLPASLPYSPTYMKERIEDGMACVSYIGGPHVFATITHFSEAPEIVDFMRALFSGENTDVEAMCLNENPLMHPMVTIRSFKARLQRIEQFLARKDNIFRSPFAYLQRCIEWQRSGLTHAHLMLRFRDTALNSAADVDRVVCARRFLPELCSSGCTAFGDFCSDGDCFAHHLTPLVDQYMTHKCKKYCGGDGVDRQKCKKHFPYPEQPTTILSEKGRWLYKRTSLEDQNVVPYNPLLLFVFRCHCHLDVCSSAGCAYYIRKYIAKLPDTIRFNLTTHDIEGETVSREAMQAHMRNYEKARFCCSAEALTRIFSYTIQKMVPGVTRLRVQLPDSDTILARNSDAVYAALMSIPDNDVQRYFYRSQLLENLSFRQYFQQHRFVVDEEVARSSKRLHFPDTFPGKRKFAVQRSGRSCAQHVVRVATVRLSSSSIELFCLRLLMMQDDLRARSYTDYLALGDSVFTTFRDAAKARGLFDDDDECAIAMQGLIDPHRSFDEWKLVHCEGVIIPICGASHAQVFDLFCTFVFTKQEGVVALFNLFWPYFVRDLISLRFDDPTATVEKLRVLSLLSKKLRQHHISLEEVGFSTDQLQFVVDQEQLDEVAEHDRVYRDEMERLAAVSTGEEEEGTDTSLSDEQQRFVETVFQHVLQKEHKMFFLQGSAGVGKTRTVKELMRRCRASGFVVHSSAFMANTARQLPGSDTCHRNFRLPLNLVNDETTASPCVNLTPAENRGVYLRQADVVIIEEIGMLHKSFVDLMEETTRHVSEQTTETWWGGKVVLFLGDFKQLGPVLKDGGELSALAATAASCSFWSQVKQVSLTQQFRILDEEYLSFCQSIGTGIITGPEGISHRSARSVYSAEYPWWLRCVSNESELDLEMAFPFHDPSSMLKRPMIAFTHQMCQQHNERISAQCRAAMQSSSRCYSAINELLQSYGEIGDSMATSDFLRATEDPASMPSSTLQLFVGQIVILTRNINPSTGLVNGRKAMVVSVAHAYLVEVSLAHDDAPAHASAFVRTTHFVPRIWFDYTIVNCFHMRRKQYPFRAGYCATVNKSQGLTMPSESVMAFDMRGGCFSHGHVYCALTRVRTSSGIIILKENEDDRFTNIVYSCLLTMAGDTNFAEDVDPNLLEVVDEDLDEEE